MRGFFRMNNDIFEYRLTPNEYNVLAYLYSCADKHTCIAKVKQSKIAEKCGIRQVETVARIISRLKEKGLIADSERRLKRNLVYGTYRYTLQRIKPHAFFCVPRFIIGKITAIQMRMYLFVCKCLDKTKKMWNSYNDISRQLGVKRDSVISVIKELVEGGFLKKRTVLKKDGSYSDNHYELVAPEQTENNHVQTNHVQTKEKATRMFAAFEWQVRLVVSIYNLSCVHYIITERDCQYVGRKNLTFIFYLSGVVP